MRTATRDFIRTTDWSRLLWLAAGGSVGIAVLAGLAVVGQVRMAFALVFLSILIGLACISVYGCILATFGYLTILGDLRRWLLAFAEWSGADPLLVVGPAVAILLWGVAMTSDRAGIETPLSRWILLLMGIMIVQIFNPIQGGLLVGAAGAMFLLVPLLWYWVGKSFGSEALLRMLFFRLLVPLACLAALFGLYQVAFGYPEYQLEWYRVGGYTALGPSEEYLRPLSIFANLTEYAEYLGVAILALLVPLLRGRSSLGSVLLIALLFGALFLIGTRGPVLFLIITGSILWALLGRSVRVWVPRLAIAILIGGVGLIYGLSQVAQVEGQGRAQFNIRRQAELVPEGKEGGPISTHLNLIRIAGNRTMERPLGHGLGYVTLAAGRFGDEGFSSEKDFTDMFLALGIPGGIVYLIVLAYATLLAIYYWMRTRSTVGLIVIGLLLFSVFGWLQPGQYVMTPLVWFCVGSLDRMQSAHPHTD
jgi:hypothetical protein